MNFSQIFCWENNKKIVWEKKTETQALCSVFLVGFCDVVEAVLHKMI